MDNGVLGVYPPARTLVGCPIDVGGQNRTAGAVRLGLFNPPQPLPPPPPPRVRPRTGLPCAVQGWRVSRSSLLRGPTNASTAGLRLCRGLEGRGFASTRERQRRIVAGFRGETVGGGGGSTELESRWRRGKSIFFFFSRGGRSSPPKCGGGGGGSGKWKAGGDLQMGPGPYVFRTQFSRPQPSPTLFCPPQSSPTLSSPVGFFQTFSCPPQPFRALPEPCHSQPCVPLCRRALFNNSAPLGGRGGAHTQTQKKDRAKFSSGLFFGGFGAN